MRAILSLIATIFMVIMSATAASYNGNYGIGPLGEDDGSQLHPVVSYVLSNYMLDSPLYYVDSVNFNESNGENNVSIKLSFDAKYYDNETLAGFVKSFQKPLITAKKQFPEIKSSFLHIWCPDGPDDFKDLYASSSSDGFKTSHDHLGELI